MTPAQEAKEFAAAHALSIETVGRRYTIVDMGGRQIAEVGGYPAALNAMKRWVCDNAFPEGWKVVDTSVDEGEVHGTDAGTPHKVELVCIAESSIDVNTRLIMSKPSATAPRPKIIEALKTYGIQFTPGTRSGDERGPMATVPGPKWRVWQRNVEGFWRPLIPFASRAEAVKYCRQLANIRSLRNLTREIRYEV